jgi:hypothetical protein
MTRSRLILHVLRAALPAGLLLALAVPTPAEPAYPRLGLYGSIRGDGTPFLDADGYLDLAVVEQVARYDEVTLEASPISEYRPDILAALRARNPDITLLAYVLGHDIWHTDRTDSLVHIPTRYRRLVRDLDGYLYNREGEYFSLFRVNLAKRDGTGRFVVAEGLADLFHDAIVRAGVWDGIFLDVYCDDVGWAESPAESIDVVRAGYPDTPSLDAAWRVAADTLASRLRRLCGPDFILVGNCGVGTKQAWFQGWMRENFPMQGGGGWNRNMFRVPGGYFDDEVSFLAPPHNFIFSWSVGTAPYVAGNVRKARFGLGSATLGTGFGVFGPADRNALTAPYHAWWYDEYAVDLATGRSSGSREHTGWLGVARGPWSQMIWVGTGPDAVSNPGFEDSVLEGWWLSFDPSVPTTVTRDTTVAAVGRASAKIHVERAGTVDWYSTYATSGELSMTAGVVHSATFWARASKPRRFSVAAAVPGTTYDYRIVEVDTTWRQYQAALIPRQSCTAQLHFTFGTDDGDVWLDDVHLQTGATSLYRRDFENGIVLVNPAQEALTVPLGATYRRILGTVDPVTNDGSWVTEVRVPAEDALFLLGGDAAPPAAPRDLRVAP